MPSGEKHGHSPHDSTSSAYDQHGRQGLDTLHKEPLGTEDDEKPENNPGVKEDGEEEEKDDGEKDDGGDQDGMSGQDVKNSIQQAVVSVSGM